MVPALAIDVSVAATNKAPVSSVRGAGYPQAAFAMERLLDRVARELEARPRRTAPPQSHPAREDALHQAAEGALRRQHALRQRRLSGLPGRAAGGGRLGRLPAAPGGGARARAATSASGSPTPSRAPAAARSNPALVRVSNTGRVSVHTGAAAIGQGLGTILAQICAGELGLKPEDITVVPGDTGGVSLGLGAFASRQTVTAGSSVLLAARAVAGKAKKLASHLLEAAEHDLELVDGEVRVVGAPGLVDQARGAVAHPQGRAGLRLPARHRAGARGQRQLAHRRAGLCQHLPRRGGRGRHRDRRRARAQLRGDAGFRRPDQPDAGRRPGAGRRRARPRQRAAGMDGLRRLRPAGDDHVRRLSAAGAPEVPNVTTLFKQTPSPLNPLGAKGAGEVSTIPAAARSSRRSRMRCSRSACASRRRRSRPRSSSN